MADLLKPTKAVQPGRRRNVMRGTTGRPAANAARLRSTVHKDGAVGSENPDSHKLALIRQENSYKLNPQDTAKFQAGKVEKLMLEILKERLGKMTYESSSCQLLAKELATEIQKRVKDFRWQRYKIVCNVTLGQKKQQPGLQAASRCVWDQSLDSQASVTFENNSIFVVAQCYGIYFE